MVLPIILIGIGAAAGAGGVGLGAKGAHDIHKANDRIKAGAKKYERARHKLEAHEKVTNASLRVLGEIQRQSIDDVVDRMADFLRRHEKQVSASEKMLVDGLENEISRVKLADRLEPDAVAWMRGVVGSTVTGMAVRSGVTTAVTSLATASTGTAISTLSGAAATNATLAVLGGGTIAEGAGGMALGATVLNVVTLGPALLVTGFMIAGKGEKAATRARKNEATINEAIAAMKLTKATFAVIVQRSEELQSLLTQLADRAIRSLDLLESEPFDPALHADRFAVALETVFAVKTVAAAQVVAESGAIDPSAKTLKVKYKALLEENIDD